MFTGDGTAAPAVLATSFISFDTGSLLRFDQTWLSGVANTSASPLNAHCTPPR